MSDSRAAPSALGGDDQSPDLFKVADELADRVWEDQSRSMEGKVSALMRQH